MRHMIDVWRNGRVDADASCQEVEPVVLVTVALWQLPAAVNEKASQSDLDAPVALFFYYSHLLLCWLFHFNLFLILCFVLQLFVVLAFCFIPFFILCFVNLVQGKGIAYPEIHLALTIGILKHFNFLMSGRPGRTMVVMLPGYY